MLMNGQHTHLQGDADVLKFISCFKKHISLQDTVHVYVQGRKTAAERRWSGYGEFVRGRVVHAALWVGRSITEIIGSWDTTAS